MPRLMAVGANLDRVHLVSAVLQEDGKGRRTFNLQADLDLLEEEIRKIGDVALIIIDPISSYMGKTDSHKNAEVRGALEPLSEMAARLNVAILSITHFSKSGSGNSSKALHRFIGSIAFPGAPRAAFAVIEDTENEGRVLFLPVKNNMVSKPQGLAYRLVQVFVDEQEGILASHIVWDNEPVSTSADEALRASEDQGNRSAAAEAEDFLRDKLTDGLKVPAKEAEEHANALGIAPRTLKRARKKLGVVAEKAGVKEGWTWHLPPEECQTPPKGAKEKVGPLRQTSLPRSGGTLGPLAPNAISMMANSISTTRTYGCTGNACSFGNAATDAPLALDIQASRCDPRAQSRGCCRLACRRIQNQSTGPDRGCDRELPSARFEQEGQGG